jgi:uncharacterized membrane protein YfcA
MSVSAPDNAPPLAPSAQQVVGAALLPYADRDLIKGTLGVVLLLATVHLAWGANAERE